MRPRRFAIVSIILLIVAILPTIQQPPSAKAAGGAIRWGWYVTYDSTSFDSLSANIDSLDMVSPWYYKLDGSGNVIGSAQANVDTLLRTHHIKNLPMIQNIVGHQGFHDLIADATKRDVLVNKLYHLVVDGNYDGINLDFESLLPTDTDLYTDFVSRVAVKIHAAKKLVTVDLPAKTKDPSVVAGAYDYAALGSIVDYAAVMAYDYHYTGGTPGPIAPPSWVKQLADYTKPRIPAAKVLWGIDFYGLDWNTTTHAWAESLHYSDIAVRQQQYNGQSGYDNATQSPWMTYTDGAGNHHEVWYENAASFQAKLNTIAPYNFGGVATWRLGHEDPADWPIFAALGGNGGGGGGGGNFCAPVAPFPNSSTRVYFAQTGHSLSGRFLQYWQQHGGLPIYGYPLTEEHQEVSPTDGRTYTVQYFERNRFEYHPENQPPFDVLLGLLGVQAMDGNFAPPHDPVDNTNTQHYFPETQHVVQGGFLNYWQTYGGLAQFGYPLTDEIAEVSPTDGKTYTVQYFERARFEFHPEFGGTFNEVELGLLGVNSVKAVCP